MESIGRILQDAVPGAQYAAGHPPYKPQERVYINGMTRAYPHYRCFRCGEWKDQRADPGACDKHDHQVCTRCFEDIKNDKIKYVGQGPVEAEVDPAYALAALTDFTSTIRAQLLKWPLKSAFMGLKGLPGRGKTHAISAIARAMAKEGRLVKIQNAIQLKQRWAGIDISQREAYFDLLIRTPWLVIDDITGPGSSPGWAELLLRIVDQRVNTCRPMIVSSMDDGKTVLRLYGNALLSRMKLFDWIKFEGKDRREDKQRKESDENETVKS
jgi:hypothetical protein